jgi:uncharacterized protein YjbI with pentapeptide repeats
MNQPGVSKPESSARPTLTTEHESLLEAHSVWLRSDGQEGECANLAGCCLAGADLAGRTLRSADLTRADLRQARLNKADLTGADLTGANLQDADCSDARLDGAILEGANVTCTLFNRARFNGARLQGVQGFSRAQLRDACLDGVQGLTADDLAGADLTGVQLPAALAGMDRQQHLADAIGIARPLYLFVLVVTGFLALTVFSTPDVALVTNAPSAVMPNLSTNIPAASLFWIAPLILLFIYAYLHFYMARVWDDIEGLPAVLPDGTRIERSAHPWLFTELARLRDGMSEIGFREAVVIFLMWGAVPATMLAMWWRYLPLRDAPVTLAQIVLVLVAAGSALRLYSYAMTRLYRRNWRLKSAPRLLWLLGCAMVTISGLFHGLPWLLDRVALTTSDAESAHAEVESTKPKNVLWLIANLEDGNLSGALLTQRDLRYAHAHRAKLVEANLKDSDLAGADFQRADFGRALLEDVNLSHANLDSAHFRNACLRRASLARSDLEDTDFTGAYLGGADLRYAYLVRARLQHANLQGALLTGADFGGADLRGAVFNCFASHQHDRDRKPEVRCAELSSTDFKDADLAGAQFLGTDLTRARNLTAAQLQSACGVDAVLPANLQDALPKCGALANRGLAPGALSADSPVNPEDNPCWHEMRSDFAPSGQR